MSGPTTGRRSAQWYAGSERDGYIHRAWMRRGLPAHAFDGRPHIAIANTASDLTPCNAHLDEVAQSREAGSLRGRRHPAEPAGRVTRRNAGPADGHALAQHGCDGDRGDVAGQPDRRRGPARRLRQDDPRAPDGCGLGRPTGRRRPGRTHAHRYLSGPAPWLRHRRLPALRRGPRRDALAGGLHPIRVLDDPQPRALQHDGDGLDHGPGGGGARDGATRLGRHSGRQTAGCWRARTRPAG